VGIRTKLLLLTLIPLVPLAALNAVGLFSLDRRHQRDLGHRLDRAEELWRQRVAELTSEAAHTADVLARSKRVEAALRRNHWSLGRESVTRAVLAERDLRALLVDADGRTLADSRSEHFDLAVGDRRLVSEALADETAEGLERLEGTTFYGTARPVRVVGGLEGAVLVGFSFDRSLLLHFARRTRSELVLVDPLSGASVGTLADTPTLPATPVAFGTEGGDRRFRFRPVRISLPGADRPLVTYVGLDHTALADAVRTQLRSLVTVFLVLLVGILALSVSMSNRIVTGLRFVVAKMQLLRSGEYERIDPVVGRDEIAYLGHGFNDMIDGLAERDFVRETFGRYMSSEVARAVLDDPEGLELGGEERTVTIMMCDLRGFTAFSGAHRPDEVVRVLNVWLEAMSEVIVAHRGTINEFLGDAILALFGAPVARDDDAPRAVACALAMQRALAGVNERLEAEGIPPLHMGVGLATGVVVAGNIGSDKRIKYGVVGQPVNLASRVESFTIGGDVLVDDATLLASGDLLETGPHRDVQVKGQEETLRIHPALAVGAPWDVRLPAADVEEETHTPLPFDARVRLWPIHGKQVAGEALEGRVAGVSARSVELRLPEELPPWSDVKLGLEVAGELSSDTIYGKVIEATRGEEACRVQVRLTRLAAEDRRFLERLVERGEEEDT